MGNALNPLLPPTAQNTGRVVITEADGNVIVDTGKPDCRTNVLTLEAGSASGNNVIASGTINSRACDSLQNFNNRDVNENHGSRITMRSAQDYPCGLVVETKFSTSVSANQIYMAERLNDGTTSGLMSSFLNSNGTLRVCVNAK